MSIRDWFRVHHCKYISSSDEDIVSRDFLTAEVEGFEDSLVHGLLSLDTDVAVLNRLRDGRLTYKGLVFIH